MSRIARHPDLLVWWNSDGPVVRNLESGLTLSGNAASIEVLAVFDRPREIREAAKRLPFCDVAEVRGRVQLLRRHGFLISEVAARRQRSRIATWKENVASALHHSASRDLRYVRPGPAAERLARELAADRRPALSKSYPARVRKKLGGSVPSRAELEPTLEARRTVRAFRRHPVSLGDLAAIVSGTWGRTGTNDMGIFGSLMTKTSPSAGSLHPIECYVLAWNVRGLVPGLYHYDVNGNDLRRLRRGGFRAEAVHAASGQSWVGRAAFLCMMTAVFPRSLWKYQDEVTYRTLFLDAGHLAQTFCLLATARGLGPFTTAALQDSYIEKLIGLDGVKEFPVYLCGAGVPRSPARRRSPR